MLESSRSGRYTVMMALSLTWGCSDGITIHRISWIKSRLMQETSRWRGSGEIGSGDRVEGNPERPQGRQCWLTDCLSRCFVLLLQVVQLACQNLQ